MTQLSGIAGEIEAVIGLDRATTLLRQRGGTEISIPVRPAGTALARIVGTDACKQLIDAFGPGKIRLPLAGQRGLSQVMRARKVKAMQMLRGGASLQEVALACDLHERTVSKYRRELNTDADARQGKLDL